LAISTSVCWSCALAQFDDRGEAELVAGLCEKETLVGLIEKLRRDANACEGIVCIKPCRLHIAHDHLSELARFLRRGWHTQLCFLGLRRVENAVEDWDVYVGADSAIPTGDVVLTGAGIRLRSLLGTSISVSIVRVSRLTSRVKRTILPLSERYRASAQICTVSPS
jgi:hypothetical protein